MAEIFQLRNDDRRHSHDRRHGERGFSDRRRNSRRKRTLRGLMLGMFAISVPATSSRAPNIKTSEGFVSITEEYRPLPAAIAYNDVIAEAADLYSLDPNLIRAIIRA